MAGTHLTDLEIGLTLQRFLEVVWENGDYLKDFLQDKLLEKEVNIADWISVSPDDATLLKYERTITSLHPLPLALPWLPLFVKSSNTQTLEYDLLHGQLRIVEVSTIKGLPFVDPYIITTWEVLETSTGSCDAHINLRFEYDKTSWLQSMVESNSQAELIIFFEKWQIYFTEKLQSLADNSELENSRGLYFLGRLLPAKKTESNDLNHAHEKIISTVYEVSNSSATSIISSSQENVEMFSSESSSTIISDVLQNSETVEVDCVPEHSENNAIESMKVAQEFHDLQVQKDPISADFSKINILKICLNGLQSNGVIKLIAAIVINLYAKINVAAFHGIEVTDIIRSILDQTASLSLIYCLILIAEITVSMSTAMIPSLLSSDIGSFSDDTDEGNSSLQSPFGGFFKPIFKVVKCAAITLFQSKTTVVCVSRGTQTDFTLVNDGIQINTATMVGNNSETINVVRDDQIVIDSSKFSVKDTVDITWRDCNSPTLQGVRKKSVPKV